ncbi:MAG: DUF4011 domain-containing protein, partial [Planctomycetota bacterium]
NRLLSTPRHRKRTRALEIVDERSDALFDRLVTRGGVMTFDPAAEKPKQEAAEDQGPDPEAPPEVEEGSAGALFHGQPDDAPEETEPEEAEGPADDARHHDRKLQTTLTSAELQKRLLRTFYDARTSEQEQGVNTLYLALGFLKWYEDAESEKDRYAPLLLVPVQLERKNARTRFSLRHDEGEIDTNLSLQAKLRAEFGIDLPDVPDLATLEEPFRPSDYFARVREAVESVPRWGVLDNDVVLSFFSFSKFLMYRDLDPVHWGDPQSAAEALDAHPLLGRLLGETTFDDEPPILPDGVSLDEVLPPEEMVHVVPADTSQAVAIEAVRRGHNLVVQGPPGTGKSQTIANLIAAAVREGKRVLFVAEKMAALEVVQRRLANVGLGEMCLELHSHKARKRAVLDDLETTLALGEVKPKTPADYFERLTAARDALNRHAEALHQPIGCTSVTAYHAIGRLIALRAAGVEPNDVSLDAPTTWDASRAADARQALASLIEQVDLIDTPAEHAWRGAGVESILPTDRQRLTETLPDTRASLVAAADRVASLAEALADDRRATPALATELANRARRVAPPEAPPADREAIARDVWDRPNNGLAELVDAGRALTDLKRQLDGKVSEAAWTADLTQTRLDLAAYGSSWLRWLNGAYKRAKRQLAGVSVGPVPKPLTERLERIDRILEAQRLRKTIEQQNTLGEDAFGHPWRGESSDFAGLGRLLTWDQRNADDHGDAATCRRLLAEHDDETRATWPSLADAAESAVDSAQRAFDSVAQTLQLDLSEAFGVDDAPALPLRSAAERLERWQVEPDGLSRWISYRTLKQRATAAGLGTLVSMLHDGQILPGDGINSFELAYHEALLREAYHAHPELARFDGDRHEQLIEQFCTLDQARVALARREVAAAHHAKMPRGRMAAGQMGVLLGEFNRKRGHLPIRQLLSRAGLAVQGIKPVFMMSPMSVAQYLAPGELSFDLVLMDEASQVRPVDALGAITRGSQVVVVGDDKQLPPTSFFDSLSRADDDEEHDDDTVATGDLESILSLCKSRAMPGTMLRWHYRSRHPSLIAVSNREFYGNDLFTIPSPDRFTDDLGLEFVHITEGHYDRSGSRTHDAEARAVAEAVMDHARTRPRLTLGVGTFSVAQRDAVLDHVERLRREDPSAEAFFAEDGAEPFFVKNLENIQGDERDVIFISVGYGPDEDGKLLMNFGPLSNEGGERRLNVLITRSKRRCVVFSSITSSDIDLSRTGQRGPEAFKAFLHFAEHGSFSTEGVDEGGFGSPFEQEVARALTDAGHEVVPRVGSAGFYVDLAVVDPEKPGRYLLGVECDGPSYRNARSARERDRARQSILEMMGWTIHRVWSTDWFNRPKAETAKLIEAIEQARGGDPVPPASPRPRKQVVIERTDGEASVEVDRFAGVAVTPYVEAGFKKLPRKELDDLTVFERMALVTKVVEIEGPVHRDEVVRRSADIYRVERLTGKVSSLLESAVGDAVNAGKLSDDGGGFLTMVGDAAAQLAGVRSRSDVGSSGLRKPEMLPPTEVRLALREVVRVAIGVSREDAVIEASRLLGFASTRSSLREVMERELAGLVADGGVEERDGGLFVVEAAPGD